MSDGSCLSGNYHVEFDSDVERLSCQLVAVLVVTTMLSSTLMLSVYHASV